MTISIGTHVRIIRGAYENRQGVVVPPLSDVYQNYVEFGERPLGYEDYELEVIATVIEPKGLGAIVKDAEAPGVWIRGSYGLWGYLSPFTSGHIEFDTEWGDIIFPAGAVLYSGLDWTARVLPRTT